MLVGQMLQSRLVATTAIRIAALGEPATDRRVFDAHQIAFQALIATALVAVRTGRHLKVVNLLNLVLVARVATIVLLILAVVPVVLIVVGVVVIVLGGGLTASTSVRLAVLTNDILLDVGVVGVVLVPEEEVVPALLGALQTVVVLLRGALWPRTIAGSSCLDLRGLPSHLLEVLERTEDLLVADLAVICSLARGQYVRGASHHRDAFDFVAHLYNDLRIFN